MKMFVTSGMAILIGLGLLLAMAVRFIAPDFVLSFVAFTLCTFGLFSGLAWLVSQAGKHALRY